MGNRVEPDIENLLRRGVKSNPEHKKTLRARLFHAQEELSLDELENVTGGVAQETRWEPWAIPDK